MPITGRRSMTPSGREQRGVYSEEEVLALLRAVKRKEEVKLGKRNREGHTSSSEDEEDEWKNVKYKSTVNKEQQAMLAGRREEVKRARLMELKCYACGEFGHFAAQCHLRHGRSYRSPLTRRQTQVMGSPKNREEENVYWKFPKTRITITPAITDAKLKYSKKFGIVRVAFGKPTEKEIVQGLKEINGAFAKWWWKLYEFGDGFKTEFPSESWLNQVVKINVKECKMGEFGLRFSKWTGEEEAVAFKAPVQVWVGVRRFPLHCWETTAFEELVNRFGMLLEVDRRTRERTKLNEAKIKVGCKMAKPIPAELPVVVDGKVIRVTFKVEKEEAEAKRVEAGAGNVR